MMKLIPTEEEVRLLRVFNDETWTRGVEKVGLKGSSVESASLTKSGVVANVRLDGRCDISDMRRLIPKIRILLDVLDSDILDISLGGRATLVQVAVRTRRATDMMDMMWHPGITSLGVDTITGEEVDFPWNERALFGGSSGSGKSWSVRPLMARAVVDPYHEILGFIDAKGEEASQWRGIIPVAVTAAEIIEMIEDAFDESCSRGRIMERSALNVWDLAAGPRKYLVIDEGQKVLQIVMAEDARRKRRSGSGDDEEGADDELEFTVEQKLLELTSIGRSREIVVIYATQNPILSGKAPGITTLMSINFDFAFCLRVRTKDNTTTVLGPGATVQPHDLPKGNRYRGHGYLNEHGDNLIRTWTVTNEAIRSLARFR